MKHVLILKYQNLEPITCPLLTFDDAIALPNVGDEFTYISTDSIVEKRRFVVSRDEIRVVLTLTGEGLPESPYLEV